METKHVRKRLAVVVAGALLASALVTSVAPVAADGEDAPSVEQRDNHAGQDETGMAGETRLTITSVDAPAPAATITEAAPAQDVPLSQGRDDYN